MSSSCDIDLGGKRFDVHNDYVVDDVSISAASAVAEIILSSTKGLNERITFLVGEVSDASLRMSIADGERLSIQQIVFAHDIETYINFGFRDFADAAEMGAVVFELMGGGYLAFAAEVVGLRA